MLEVANAPIEEPAQGYSWDRDQLHQLRGQILYRSLEELRENLGATQDQAAVRLDILEWVKRGLEDPHPFSFYQCCIEVGVNPEEMADQVRTILRMTPGITEHPWIDYSEAEGQQTLI